MGGEGSAAHTHDAAVFHQLQQGMGVLLQFFLVGPDAFIRRIQPIVIDHDAHDLLPVGVQPGFHRRNGAGNAGMDGCGYETGGLSDQLAHFYRIPLLHHRLAGGADMHAHGDHHLGRRGQRRYG